MKINTFLLLPVCIILLGGTAGADYAVIKYRSGDVQTILLDEPSSKILSISYREDNTSPAQSLPSGSVKAGNVEPAGETGTPRQLNAHTPQEKDKQQVRIEWAQPLE